MVVARLVLDYLETLAWPLLALLVIILFRKELRAILGLLGRLSRAGLPGGVSLDFKNDLLQAQQLGVIAEQAPSPSAIPDRNSPMVPLNRVNARHFQLGLRPTQSGLDLDYYVSIARQDPNLSLAALRMELEVMVSNLAKGFDIQVDPRDGVGRILRKLLNEGAVTKEQVDLGMVVLRLCNAAVHGEPISSADAIKVIQLVQSTLAEDYIRWLSWGFDKPWDDTSDPAPATVDARS